MKIKVYVVLIGIVLHSFTLKAQSWITIDTTLQEQRPIIELLEADAEQYKIKVRVPGFYKEQINHLEAIYDALSFEGYSTLDVVGEPALPTITQLIGLPSYGMDCYASIENPVWVNVDIGRVYPFQSPLLETEEQQTFEVSTEAYNKLSYEPELVNFGDVVSYKGLKNTNLQICPFRYFPLENKLSVMREFIVNVYFNGIDGESSEINTVLPGVEGIIGVMSNYNTALMDTYNTALVRNRQRTNGESYNYLIIGGRAELLNSDILREFCRWKAFKGYECKIVSTATIGNSANDIKSFLKAEQFKGVQYVLFVGDTDAVPVYSGKIGNKNVAGDYWYGCLDGDDDFQADIAIGRFSANTIEELTNMINKTITYESNPSSVGWQNKALMIAHKENAPGKYQRCLENIRNSTYAEPYTFIRAYGANESLGGNRATNVDVINKINEGVGIVNYRGHGSETSWASGWSYDNVGFGMSHINSLNNTAYPVVFSVACLNANIVTDECFLEAFTRSPKGAVGVLGSFYSSYTIQNHDFNQFLFETLCNDGTYNVGDINNIAHIKTLVKNNNNVNAKFNTFIYLWGGDPSLEIWTDTSQCFNDIDISRDVNGNINLDVGDVDNYKIRIVTEDGALKNEYTSTVSTFSLTGIDSPCYIVVDKHNYIPYVLYCVPETSYIQNIAITQDSYFYGDNVIIGSDVASTTSSGNVIIDENSQVIVDATARIVIKNGFICRKGSKFIMK